MKDIKKTQEIIGKIKGIHEERNASAEVSSETRYMERKKLFELNRIPQA